MALQKKVKEIADHVDFPKQRWQSEIHQKRDSKQKETCVDLSLATVYDFNHLEVIFISDDWWSWILA